MVNFGGLSLPHVSTIKQQVTRTYLEVPLPYRVFDYKADLGGQGSGFTVDGFCQSADSVTKAQIDALSDGTARILDLEEAFLQPFDNVLYYQSPPAWTVDTTAAHLGGSPFTILATTSNYMYFGYHGKFNKIQFLLSQLGSYPSGLLWEYSQGNANWNTLTPSSDGTSSLSASGTVVFTPPSDWQMDTVNGILNMFWVRVSALSVTTQAKASQIFMNPCFLCILLNPLYTYDVTEWDKIAYELTFQQQENPLIASAVTKGFEPAGFDPTGFN